MHQLTSYAGRSRFFKGASSRSVVAMQKLLAGVPLRLPVIEFNGAFLSDLATGRHEVVHEIDRALIPEILRLIVRQGCAPFVSTFAGREDRLYWERVVNEGMRWYYRDWLKAGDKRLRHTAKLADTFGDRVVCFTVIDRREPLVELRAKLAELCGESVDMQLFENEYSRGWHWLTVHDRNATKERAVGALLRRLGLTSGDLTVFGDNTNDIGMFRLAARAVAVANAVPELKRHAAEVIGSNEEDSVARYLLADWTRA